MTKLTPRAPEGILTERALPEIIHSIGDGGTTGGGNNHDKFDTWYYIESLYSSTHHYELSNERHDEKLEVFRIRALLHLGRPPVHQLQYYRHPPRHQMIRTGHHFQARSPSQLDHFP